MDEMAPLVGETPNWDEIYSRELEEVYLLLDFIAGRPDRQLALLEVEISEQADECATATRTVRKLGAPEIAERISALRCPPAGTAVKRSQEAAFLLLVKDRLCALAHPATAQSIAFTDLVVMKATLAARSRGKRFAEYPKPGAQPDPSRSWHRVAAGLRAFPDLEAVAVRFRWFRRLTTIVAVALVAVGWILLAEATYGGQLTSRLQAAKREAAAAAAAIYSTYGANHLPGPLGGPVGASAILSRVQDVCPLPPKPGEKASSEPKVQYASTSLGQATNDATTAPSLLRAPSESIAPTGQEMRRLDLLGNVDSKYIQLCDDYAYAATLFDNAIVDVDAYVRSSAGKLISFLVPIHDLGLAEPECEKSSDKQHCGPKQETGPSVSGMVSAFANYLLPLIFALVGALSSTIRTVQDKIRDSVLVPRDMSLLWLRILLGGVAGASVGLFFDPSRVAAEITNGHSGLSVSASGIAFLAGYGAPAFFAMLDTMLSRVFNFSTSRGPVDGAAEAKAR